MKTKNRKNTIIPRISRTGSNPSGLRGACLAAVISATLTGPALAQDIGTGFTYQGSLRNSGGPVTGNRSFEVELFDSASGGNLVAGPVVIPNVPVDGGLFNLPLDFGGAADFANGPRWLEITVAGQTLSPRQRVTTTPVAQALPAFTSVQSTMAPSLIGGWSGNFLDNGILGATLSGGGTADDGNGVASPNQITDHYGTVGGGIANHAGDDNGVLDDAMFATVGGGYDNRATAEKSTVAGGFINRATALQAAVGGGEANEATGESSTIAGGANNVASDTSATVGGGGSNEASGNTSTVAGGNGNRASGFEAAILGGSFNQATNASATVGGGTNNSATANFSAVFGGEQNEAVAFASFIGGGRLNSATNTSTVVSGGEGNTASAGHAVVGGGQNNSALGQFSVVGGGGGLSGGPGNVAHDSYCTVGGGVANVAGDPDTGTNNMQATVAGGFGNQATGFASAIGGGQVNQTTAQLATVPGGFDNIASGYNSFAAGQNARAAHANSFVWSDGSGGSLAPFSSTADDEFNVLAAGGTRIFSNGSQTAGVRLFPGGNSWSVVSDRNAKENFDMVDTRAVLDKLSEIPVMTWNMRTQPEEIVHMGPTAQDFHAAFGLGESNRHISSSDADGVALAGVQGLYEIVREQGEELKALEVENKQLRNRIESIENMLRNE